MANQWLRLWHEMPNDPKFRVIAKVSEQPISLVISLYVTLLCDASRHEMSRGVTTCRDEELAVTLDCDIAQIAQIKCAMQGRLLDGDALTGWSKRQPKKEDSGDAESGAKSATERQRAHRDKLRRGGVQTDVTTCHDVSRNVTLDKDKDKEEDQSQHLCTTGVVLAHPTLHSSQNVKSNLHTPADSGFEKFWATYPKRKNRGRVEKVWAKLKPSETLLTEILQAIAVAETSDDWIKDGGQFIPYPETWLNAKGWLDDVSAASYRMEEIAVMEQYGASLADSCGWPEVAIDPFSRERAVAIREFLACSTRPDWVKKYFDWLAENLDVRDGCGFDWAIKKDTFLRVKEGNFSAMKVAK